MAHALKRLVIGDDPDAWRTAGFSVIGNEIVFGKVTVELAGTSGARGVLGWRIDGVASDVAGIRTVPSAGEVVSPAPRSGLDNTNAIFAIDHVVVETGDLDQTVRDFVEVGMSERRRGQITTPHGERGQSFLWAGRVIIEIVGPIEARSDQRVGIWGLALVSANLQTTSHVLAENISEPRDAIQPGRKIATVNHRALDISVPIVVMSPHVAELL